MVSWMLVKRFRVRREALITLGVMSSVDEKEAAEDVRDSEERESMVAEGDYGGRGQNLNPRGSLYVNDPVVISHQIKRRVLALARARATPTQFSTPFSCPAILTFRRSGGEEGLLV